MNKVERVASSKTNGIETVHQLAKLDELVEQYTVGLITETEALQLIRKV